MRPSGLDDARELLRLPLESAGERQDCTVYFSDIAGFTPLAELLTPAAVLRMLNGYFTALSGNQNDFQTAPPPSYFTFRLNLTF